MKKIIVSIVVIGLLFSAVPLSIGVNESENEQEEIVATSSSGYLEPITRNTNDEPPRLFDKPEYTPGEVIVKFKDEVDVSLSSSQAGTVSDLITLPASHDGAMTIGATSSVTLEEVMTTIGVESLSLDETTIIGVTSTSTEEVITTGIESIDKLNMMCGVKLIEKLIEDDSAPSLSNVYKFTFDENVDVMSAVDEYSNDPSVEFAEPNYIYQHCEVPDESENQLLQSQPYIPGYIPNDPYFDMQWALHNTGQNGGTPDADIDAPEAWDTEMGDDDIVIAIIDTGVDYTNPDLGECTDGITEVEYSFESSHPIDEHYEVTLDFAEIFPEYDFDAVSLHFSRIDVGGWFDVTSGELNISFDMYDFKWLFNADLHGSNVTDFWTVFTEMDNLEVNIGAHFMENEWGFAIDKVKLLKWKKLSRISDKFVDGYDFFCHDPDPMDDFGHGTHCAGIAAAITDNLIGVAGIAGNCKIMPIRIGSFMMGMTAFAIVRGIIYAANHGADIISMSFGGPESKLENLALEYAYLRGVVLIAAAGNDDLNLREFAYPAAHKKVIAVAATDRNDTKAVFSNYGPWVDLAAPGWDILSLRAYATDMYLGSYGYQPGSLFVPAFDKNAILYRSWGTSMSCPHVAGVAALILSKNPNLKPREVRTVLQSSTDPVIADKYIGTGRINAYLAVQKTAPVIAEFDKSLNYAIVEGNLQIKGTARGSQFEEYVVEWGRGIYPNEWEEIGRSSTPKNNDVLVTWNTNNEEEGLHSLRLTMTAGGFSYIDRTFVIVDNIANTYYVDDDAEPSWYHDENHFDNIQDAADICSDKDTIYVYSGTYNEQILLEAKKIVTIQGEDRDTTIIKNIDKDYGTILMTAGGITLRDITIKSCEYEDGFYFCGIEGISSLDCEISNCVFTECGGIWLGTLSESSVEISANNFNNSRIELFDYSKSTISENILTNVSSILIDGGKKNTLVSNIVNDGDIRIHSNNNDVYDNVLTNVDTVVGVSFLTAHRNNIHGNTISNGDIWVEGRLNYIHDNSISDGDICLSGLGFGWFISVFNVIDGNTVSNSDGTGIIVGSSSLLAGEKSSCRFNVVSNNDVSNNKNGIGLYGVCNNAVVGNTLSYNTNYGILVSEIEINPWHGPWIYSTDNKIYNNNFIENYEHARNDEGNENNTWYRPVLKVGNYWDDYEDNYPDAEKILRILLPDYWNIPYDIPVDNQDLYPLVKQYGSSQSTPQSNPSSPSSTPTSSTTGSSPTNS